MSTPYILYIWAHGLFAIAPGGVCGYKTWWKYWWNRGFMPISRYPEYGTKEKKAWEIWAIGELKLVYITLFKIETWLKGSALVSQ